MPPTPEERAWELGVRLGLDRHRVAIAAEIRAAVNAALEEAARKIEEFHERECRDSFEPCTCGSCEDIVRALKSNPSE